MIKKLMGLFHYLKYHSSSGNQDSAPTYVKDKIPRSLKEVADLIREVIGESTDVIIRNLTIHTPEPQKILVVFINGLNDYRNVEINVLKPILNHEFKAAPKNLLDYLTEEVITSLHSAPTYSFNNVIESIMSGRCILFLDGYQGAICTGAVGWETRGIIEPETEASIRGPREGFNEDILTNIALIRRKLKNPRLKIENITLGTISQTEIALCYINGIVDDNILNELKKRINKINIDSILETGYIEQFIEDHPLSPFPTIGSTERPDVVVGKILEGRIAILCDGTPFVLTVPRIFMENLQVSEDYYRRTLFASTIRLIRIMAFLVSTSLPGIYVALQTYHHEIIPFKLFLTIAGAREGIPISSFTEALMMLFIFEFLKEAGLRMPKPVGQTVTIVGAIVIGQATVEAGIASPLMVIVIALTAISGFITPELDFTIFFIRIVLLIAGNILGFYGIIMAAVGIFIHMNNIKSFGIEYLYPVAPTSQELKDSLIRFPLWSLFFDHTSLKSENRK
ncbi:spore germination protein [Alkaliphilus crotonatoxidans]